MTRDWGACARWYWLVRCLIVLILPWLQWCRIAVISKVVIWNIWIHTTRPMMKRAFLDIGTINKYKHDKWTACEPKWNQGFNMLKHTIANPVSLYLFNLQMLSILCFSIPFLNITTKFLNKHCNYYLLTRYRANVLEEQNVRSFTSATKGKLYTGNVSLVLVCKMSEVQKVIQFSLGQMHYEHSHQEQV